MPHPCLAHVVGRGARRPPPWYIVPAQSVLLLGTARHRTTVVVHPARTRPWMMPKRSGCGGERRRVSASSPSGWSRTSRRRVSATAGLPARPLVPICHANAPSLCRHVCPGLGRSAARVSTFTVTCSRRSTRRSQPTGRMRRASRRWRPGAAGVHACMEGCRELASIETLPRSAGHKSSVLPCPAQLRLAVGWSRAARARGRGERPAASKARARPGAATPHPRPLSDGRLQAVAFDERHGAGVDASSRGACSCASAGRSMCSAGPTARPTSSDASRTPSPGG